MLNRWLTLLMCFVLSGVACAMTQEDAERFRSQGAAAWWEAQRYEDIVRAAEQVVLTYPQFTQTAEQMMAWRSRALSRLGRHAEALGSAKACFNVARMEYVDEAVALLSEVIEACDASTLRKLGLPPGVSASEAARRFRWQMLDQAEDGVVEDPVVLLERIACDGRWVANALALREQDTWYGSLLEQGNLLLIADRPVEALEVFEQAYAAAPPERLAEISEAVARALKACDGGIHRSNQWLIGLGKGEAGHPGVGHREGF